MVDLVRAMRAFNPDILYLRYQPFHPAMLGLPRRTVMVVEINMDDLHEYRLLSARRARYNQLTRDVVLKRARAMVFISHELCHAAAFQAYRVRREVITNGIDLSLYPELPAPTEGPPTLVFVANTVRLTWHGIDRLLRLAELRPGWRFDIVGLSAGDGPTLPNVTWHGALERRALLGVLATADVGVGSLALYRNAKHEDSTLKVREYLAVGLPVLLAYRDPDVESLGDLTLRIPNTGTNVEDSIDEIDRFVESSRGRRVPRASVGHIDVVQKEQRRLALFADLLRA
jgi:glycosyltransferase involved in cell wall biosynthesis